MEFSYKESLKIFWHLKLRMYMFPVFYFYFVDGKNR